MDNFAPFVFLILYGGWILLASIWGIFHLKIRILILYGRSSVIVVNCQMIWILLRLIDSFSGGVLRVSILFSKTWLLANIFYPQMSATYFRFLVGTVLCRSFLMWNSNYFRRYLVKFSLNISFHLIHLLLLLIGQIDLKAIFFLAMWFGTLSFSLVLKTAILYTRLVIPLIIYQITFHMRGLVLLRRDRAIIGHLGHRMRAQLTFWPHDRLPCNSLLLCLLRLFLHLNWLFLMRLLTRWNESTLAVSVF